MRRPENWPSLLAKRGPGDRSALYGDANGDSDASTLRFYTILSQLLVGWSHLGSSGHPRDLPLIAVEPRCNICQWRQHSQYVAVCVNGGRRILAKPDDGIPVAGRSAAPFVGSEQGVKDSLVGRVVFVDASAFCRALLSTYAVRI